MALHLSRSYCRVLFASPGERCAKCGQGLICDEVQSARGLRYPVRSVLLRYSRPTYTPLQMRGRWNDSCPEAGYRKQRSRSRSCTPVAIKQISTKPLVATRPDPEVCSGLTMKEASRDAPREQVGVKFSEACKGGMKVGRIKDPLHKDVYLGISHLPSSHLLRPPAEA